MSPRSKTTRYQRRLHPVRSERGIAGAEVASIGSRIQFEEVSERAKLNFSTHLVLCARNRLDQKDHLHPSGLAFEYLEPLSSTTFFDFGEITPLFS
jgi:hypothetical protein